MTRRLPPSPMGCDMFSIFLLELSINENTNHASPASTVALDQHALYYDIGHLLSGCRVLGSPSSFLVLFTLFCYFTCYIDKLFGYLIEVRSGFGITYWNQTEAHHRLPMFEMASG